MATPPILTDKDREFFRANGYFVARGINSSDLIDDVERTFLKLLQKFEPDMFKEFSAPGILNNPELNRRALQLRKEKPAIFSAIYDTMQVTVSMQNLGKNQLVADAVAFLLDDTSDGLMSFNYLFRMDTPGDTRNKLGWHQDFLLYEQEDMSDGITAWMPLVPVDDRNGAIKVCAGSHRDSRIKGYKDPVTREEYASDLHLIPDAIVNSYTIEQPAANPGDVIFLSMNAIHCSGDNTSEYIRFTGQGRYFRLMSEHFIPGRCQFIATSL
jgi:ectoine hydroxylase-related dioxygenase (phytanoyl-CoA dioxygenase family)